jgi:hypothetical protein
MAMAWLGSSLRDEVSAKVKPRRNQTLVKMARVFVSFRSCGAGHRRRWFVQTAPQSSSSTSCRVIELPIQTMRLVSPVGISLIRV